MESNNYLSKKLALLPIIAGTITAIIWGFSFVFTKDVLNYTFPSQLLGLRFASGALFLTILKLFGLVRIELKGRGWVAFVQEEFNKFYTA